MPYNKLSDLPDNVKNHLPKHAQEIYLSTFNNAWEEYKNPQDRQGDKTREETSHSVAWSAVKKKYYKKENGEWVAF